MARAAADELSREPPTPGRPWCSERRRTLLGPLFLVVGAWMIASANACAKLLYLHGAVSVLSLFLLRSVFAYAMNAAIVASGAGGVPRASVTGVLLLRCGSWRTQLLTLLRGLTGSGGIGPLNLLLTILYPLTLSLTLHPNPNPNPPPNTGLLNLAYFNFLTFADAFAVFLGLSTMLTILGTHTRTRTRTPTPTLNLTLTVILTLALALALTPSPTPTQARS